MTCLLAVVLGPCPAQASSLLDFSVDEASLGALAVPFVADDIFGAFNAQFSRTGDAFELTGVWDGVLFLQNEGTEILFSALGTEYTLFASFAGSGVVSPAPSGNLVFTSASLTLFADLPDANPAIPLLQSTSGTGFGSATDGFFTLAFDPFAVLFPAYFVGVPLESALTVSALFLGFAPVDSTDFQGIANATFQPAVVPEPAALLLLASGVAGAPLMRWRKRP